MEQFKPLDVLMYVPRKLWELGATAVCQAVEWGLNTVDDAMDWDDE